MELVAIILISWAFGRYVPLPPRRRVPRNAAGSGLDTTQPGTDVSYTGQEEWQLAGEASKSFAVTVNGLDLPLWIRESSIRALRGRYPGMSLDDAERLLAEEIEAATRGRK